MSKPLPPELGPYQRYATTVRRLKKEARAAQQAGDAAKARACWEAISTMREDRGMKPRRR